MYQLAVFQQVILSMRGALGDISIDRLQKEALGPLSLYFACDTSEYWRSDEVQSDILIGKLNLCFHATFSTTLWALKVSNYFARMVFRKNRELLLY